jgi:hypothetical protein
LNHSCVFCGLSEDTGAHWWPAWSGGHNYMPVDQWPFTSLILSTLDKHEGAARMRAPTLLWAYGAALDRQEAGIMAMVNRRWLGRPVVEGP